MEGRAVELVAGRAAEMIGEAGEEAEEMVEAAVERMTVEVPLADEGVAVAGLLESLRQQRGAGEFRQGARPPFAGEQRGAGDDTHAAVVKAGEPDAVAGEAVDGGRGDFAAIASCIAVAHVIGENDDQVRLFGSAAEGC